MRQSTIIIEFMKHIKISKLPMRQSTGHRDESDAGHVSKLPMRQSTVSCSDKLVRDISKLPMRQSTELEGGEPLLHLSKLPMRQSTAEESERASAPSRENPSPSILPKVSTGRKKSRQNRLFLHWSKILVKIPAQRHYHSGHRCSVFQTALSDRVSS